MNAPLDRVVMVALALIRSMILNVNAEKDGWVNIVTIRLQFRHALKILVTTEVPVKKIPNWRSVIAVYVHLGYSVLDAQSLIIVLKFTHPQKALPEMNQCRRCRLSLIVVFSIAVPLLAFFFITVIICMKRRRRREHCRHDEEARRQNEQNTVHNAVNKNNMIFNSLDYPPKPLNTEVSAIHLPSTHKKGDTDDYPPSKKNYSLENAYSIAPTRSTKTLNTDVSNLSLASRLEKDLDAYGLSRNSPIVVVDPPGSVNISKTPDPHLPRTHSHSDVFLKRMNNSNSNSSSNIAPTSSPTGGGLCTSSTHTLTSVCTPSTCTTPSSVYVIEEHTDENYIATEV
ncbi:Neurogenic locus protein delta [Armadillidium nasatum]|uniref:Neurogenic locus protein delta n=1 Tax=Armadillidium nasatum TaxID=96803 RepID=A0A5N5TJY5_9CRUS|nr:Neurogenic locus protein delta [Armadillidium nasatum]